MSSIDRFNGLFTGDEATLSGDSVVVVDDYGYGRWRIPVDAFGRGMVAAERALARAVEAERVADPGEPTEEPVRVAGLAFFDEVGEDAVDAPMLTFVCWDGHGDEEEVLAETDEEAAQEYVDGVTWGDGASTVFVDVMVAEVGEALLDEDGDIDWDSRDGRADFTVAVEPDEPACGANAARAFLAAVTGRQAQTLGHDWTKTGVSGVGGLVNVTEVCSLCGVRRITDTWAQDSRGRQGLTSIRYDAAEE